MGDFKRASSTKGKRGQATTREKILLDVKEKRELNKRTYDIGMYREDR